MKLTPEQFRNATECLSAQINGIARFSFEGIAKDDLSNINLVFDNPIGLEVFFRNFSMYYDSNVPVFTNFFICRRTAKSDAVIEKFDSLVLNVTYTGVNEEIKDNDAGSDENMTLTDDQLTTQIADALTKMNDCFFDVFNEYIAHMIILFTSNEFLTTLNVPYEQMKDFQTQLVTDYYEPLIAEFVVAESLRDKNNVAQKIHTLSNDIEALKAFAQKIFPLLDSRPIASERLTFSTRDRSNAFIEHDDIMPPPPPYCPKLTSERFTNAQRGPTYLFRSAPSSCPEYHAFKTDLLLACPTARCELSSMYPTKINILFETEISRDLFKKHAESIIIYPNAISDTVPNFVSVDLTKVFSNSLTAFHGAMVALELANALSQNYERLNPVHEHTRVLI